MDIYLLVATGRDGEIRREIVATDDEGLDAIRGRSASVDAYWLGRGRDGVGPLDGPLGIASESMADVIRSRVDPDPID